MFPNIKATLKFVRKARAKLMQEIHDNVPLWVALFFLSALLAVNAFVYFVA